ncbi:MAG: hypothetical protein AB7I48_02450 [Planctomycetaceae bacterium]
MPVMNKSGRTMLRTLVGFSLVSVPLLLGGCSGAFSGKSDYEKMKDREKSFTDLIAAAGGTARIEGHERHGIQATGWFMDLSGATITDELLTALAEAAQAEPVFNLNLSKSTITDDQLARLDTDKILQKVFILNLSDTAITDAGLDRLANHYVISELNVAGTQVTDAAIQRLGDRQLASEMTPKAFRIRPKVTK